MEEELLQNNKSIVHIYYVVLIFNRSVYLMFYCQFWIYCKKMVRMTKILMRLS